MFSTKPMRKVSTNNNISEKYKFEWIAPERTGSRKVAEVLSYYGFKRNNQPIFYSNNYNHSHLVEFNELYSGYKVICNARNPYGRVYSIFKNFYKTIPDKSMIGFKQYLKNDLPQGKTLEMDSIYYVVTSDYLANGNDNMLFFKKGIQKFDLDYKLRNIIIDYFKENKSIEAKTNIRIIKE